MHISIEIFFPVHKCVRQEFVHGRVVTVAVAVVVVGWGQGVFTPTHKGIQNWCHVKSSNYSSCSCSHQTNTWCKNKAVYPNSGLLPPRLLLLFTSPTPRPLTRPLRTFTLNPRFTQITSSFTPPSLGISLPKEPAGKLVFHLPLIKGAFPSLFLENSGKIWGRGAFPHPRTGYLKCKRFSGLLIRKNIKDP